MYAAEVTSFTKFGTFILSNQMSITRVGNILHFTGDMAEFGGLACLHKYQMHTHVELSWEYFSLKPGTIHTMRQCTIHHRQADIRLATAFSRKLFPSV